MNLEQFKNATVGKTIGYGSSQGECGGYASYWFSELTNNKYQFAYGKPNITAQWAIGSDCATAWNVAYQSDWGAMGFEKIDNPTFSQLKAGDIFFISPRGTLTTGHVGIVYSVSNNNVVTLEQNFGNVRYAQYMANENSWSYFGGFTCVVRPKQNKPTPNKPKKGMINMFLICTIDKKNWYVSNGTHCKWIKSERELKTYQNQFAKLNLPVDKMYSSELYEMFPQNKIIK